MSKSKSKPMILNVEVLCIEGFIEYEVRRTSKDQSQTEVHILPTYARKERIRHTIDEPMTFIIRRREFNND